jgi:hypothetical protein
MSVPAQVHPNTSSAEIRLREDGDAFRVAPGIRLAGRLLGEVVQPPTDPGRTRIRVALESPLFDKDHQVILLPVGTQFLGQVNLLRGELQFVGFQSMILPDGRGVICPEDGFSLGSGPYVRLENGRAATILVTRPLKVEAFGDLGPR